MKLFSQTEKAFYVFKGEGYEHGTVNHIFDFTPGFLISNAFLTIDEAIAWLARATSSIKFIDLVSTKVRENGTYCIVKSRNKTYAAKYNGNNFISIVGVLLEQSNGNCSIHPICKWLDFFAKNEGEIFFFIDEHGTMIDLWINKLNKRGSFRFSTVAKFNELVEKFVEQCKK
ncbi:MAG: hypothetical protein ACFFG0_15525 [Candidatus Thorarchaeota archaeon]